MTPSPTLRGEWPALTSVNRDDAVDGGLCIHLNNRPLLSLLLAKLASSTSPYKPPATYMWVNDFGSHTDSIFRGGDLYARATCTRVYTVCCVQPELRQFIIFLNFPNRHHSDFSVFFNNSVKY